jgi:hypothetical protein
MKPTAGDTGRRVFPGRRQFVWAAIVSVIIASAPGLAQTPGQGLPAVRGGLLFEHPVEAVAESPAAAQEAGVLRATVNSARLNNLVEVAEALEAFVAENPSSAWTPSLRASLGRYYCTEGPWDATRQYQTGAGKRIADYTLA